MNSLSLRGVQLVAFVLNGALQKARAWTSKIHPVCAMLIISLAIPEEFSFYIGPMRLTVTRALLLLSAPQMLRAYFWQSGVRSRFTDILVFCVGAWMLVAVSTATDLDDALAHAAPEVLEFAAAYYAFRLWTKTREQVLATLDLFCLVISIAALVSLLDSWSGRFFIHDVSESLTGYLKERQHDHRHGLLRAEGPFEHPIHLGLMCASAVIIAFAAPIRRKRFCVAACSVALILSFSSGPLQGCVLGLCLIAYGHYFSWFKRRWELLAVAAVSLVGAAFLISNSPLAYFTNTFTFDPSSAWARDYEWQMAGVVVGQNPWFGIGMFNWPAIAKDLETFESVDSLWLAMALGYGIPGSILVGAAVFSAAFARNRAIPKCRAVDRDRKALGELLSIQLILILYSGFTVDYWASLWVWIGILMGLRTSRGSSG